MFKVLFICTGNTCRSPMAEALFKYEAAKYRLPFAVKVSSAGLSVYSCEEAAVYVRLILGKEGIDVSDHRAQNVNGTMIDEADLILVMTRDHYRRLLSCFPGAVKKTHLLKEFAGEEDTGSEINDPLGSSLEKYQEVLEEIRTSIKKIILKIKES